jgi:non-ribosomal peptide synthetase-like protein
VLAVIALDLLHSWDWRTLIAVIGAGLLPAPVTVLWLAVLARALGRAPVGVISRWDRAYLRVWIKTGWLNSANEWLSGTLLWPLWLRASGMSVGRDCEISTIIDVVPEHVVIGRGSFLADGNYLGGPRVHRGTVSLGQTELGSGVFVGNHAVIPSGTRVADDVLIGVSTVAGGQMTAPGRSWFGHPPFLLPRRPRIASDSHVTQDPSAIRYVNRLCWECLRFAIPLVPLVIALSWGHALTVLAPRFDAVTFVMIIVPVVALMAAVAAGVFVIALKWGLLGRVRPGEHALWSCWCSRWDFLYVCWGQIAFPLLSTFDGTLLLPWYLRAMGAQIGRRVVLGGGFAQLVDPDMLHIGDEATVQAQLQAHTFEDRVLKVDHVRIGRRANVSSGVVLLYGAEVGDGASVGPHSVVMKHERLTAGRTYSGCPVK